MAGEDVAIRELRGVDELSLLEPLWIELHRHHRRLLPEGAIVADDSLSWERRRADYRRWLAADEALILVAEGPSGVLGYAVTHLLDGSTEDTYAVGDRYAELYSLSVAPAARSQGIGSMLVDAVEERLEAAGIDDLMVAVMTDNVDALRFYERRALRPTELVLWRFGAGPR
jgi:ribosomal protein S18 acetylase RimI-like enzyme